MLDTAEQLQELMLFLFVWSEAANLRFMPDMLFFIFELARAHASAPQEQEWAHMEAAPNEFLTRVIKPIYKQIADNNRNNPEKDYYEHRNYDDFNEAFWNPKSIRLLRTSDLDPSCPR